MARFYTLRIGSVYLTSNGLSNGTPCRLKINGVEALRSSYGGTTSVAADGTPHTAAFSLGTKGRPLNVVVDYLPKTVLDSIVTAVNTALAANSTITLIGAGDLGSFNLSAVPALPTWLKAGGDFSGSILKSVELNFITAS